MRILKNKWSNVPIAVKVSAAYAICSVLQRSVSFFTLPIFTRLLTTEQYGLYTIYQSWSSILAIFITLNLAFGSFSTAMIKFEGDREGYLSAVQGVCLALTLFFLIVYLPFHGLWNKVFELSTSLILLMIFELLSTTAIQLWSGKKRFEYKYRSVIAVTLLTSVLGPILAYVLVINTNNKGEARIFGYAIINILIGGFFFIFNSIKGKKLLNKEYWKYALGFNIPLLAYYLSQVIFNQSDRIMISHMVGTDKAAIYGVAYTLGTVLIFILNAINNAYVPWLYEKMKTGRQEDNRRVSIGIALLLGILLQGVIWYAPEIITILASDKYTEAVPVVAPVAISILLLFYAQLFINVEFYYEEKRRLVWASIGAALINLILNWFFIQWLGFIAAAYTTLVSYILFVVANQRSMRKVLADRKIEDNAYDYRCLLLIFVGMCAVAELGIALYAMPIIRIVITAVALAVMLAMKNYFLKILMKIKR